MEEPKICVTEGCSSPKPKNRRYCWNCLAAQRKTKDPIKNAFFSLRNNAKRRGKAFDLTIDQFREFATKTNLLNHRGINKDSWHIDRIDDSKGYTIDNIQILTNEQNIKKEQLRRKIFKFDPHQKSCSYIPEYIQPKEYCPF